MKTVKEMIEAYNKKAKKWGFDELELVNSSINVEFKEKSTKGISLLKKVNVIYQNGYMKEDYNKIKNALPQITKEMVLNVEKPSHIYDTKKYEKTIEEEALENTFK